MISIKFTWIWANLPEEEVPAGQEDPKVYEFEVSYSALDVDGKKYNKDVKLVGGAYSVRYDSAPYEHVIMEEDLAIPSILFEHILKYCESPVLHGKREKITVLAGTFEACRLENTKTTAWFTDRDIVPDGWLKFKAKAIDDETEFTEGEIQSFKYLSISKQK